jgi:hypothetical protein
MARKSPKEKAAEREKKLPPFMQEKASKKAPKKKSNKPY